VDEGNNLPYSQITPQKNYKCGTCKKPLLEWKESEKVPTKISAYTLYNKKTHQIVCFDVPENTRNVVVDIHHLWCLSDYLTQTEFETNENGSTSICCPVCKGTGQNTFPKSKGEQWTETKIGIDIGGVIIAKGDASDEEDTSFFRYNYLILYIYYFTPRHSLPDHLRRFRVRAPRPLPPKIFSAA